MRGCPFYGYRWPEKSPVLQEVGGNECGLDLDVHNPCAMELEERSVDYSACGIALERRAFLQAAKHFICFSPACNEPAISLADWERRRR